MVRTGLEAVRVPGTYDVFNTLVSIRDLMRNERNLTEDEQTPQLLATAASLEEVMSAVLQNATSVGGKLQAMDSLRGALEDIGTAADTQAASLQDADILDLTTQLARTQTLYEMVLATSAKMLNMSLLDFI